MSGMRTPDPDLLFMSVVGAVVGIVSGGIGSEENSTFDFLPSNEISCLQLYDTYFQLFLKAVIVFSSVFFNLFFLLLLFVILIIYQFFLMYKFNKLNKFYLLINVFFFKFHSAFRNRTLIIIILIFTTFMMNYFLAKFNTNFNTNLQRCLQRKSL